MHLGKISFIGAGNIAEALIRGIITSGTLDPGQIIVSDVNQNRLTLMNQTLGTLIAANNNEAAEKADILFLTVKPFQVLEVCEKISSSINKNAFVISVAAGKSLRSVKERLQNHHRTCRIMPNLACGVKKGTIGLFAMEDLAAQELAPVAEILSGTGRIFRLRDEKLMPAITALSGSAPAYYVMMADALINYGVSQGLDREVAAQMILSTMEGSAAWAANGKIPLQDLWRKVVTPGGTTEAGIKHYNEKGFIEIFVEGLNRATQKAKDLGDEPS